MRKTPNRSSITPTTGADEIHNSSFGNLPGAGSTFQQSGVVEGEKGELNGSFAKKIPDVIRPSNSTSNEDQNDDSSDAASDDDLEEQVKNEF